MIPFLVAAGAVALTESVVTGAAVVVATNILLDKSSKSETIERRKRQISVSQVPEDIRKEIDMIERQRK